MSYNSFQNEKAISLWGSLHQKFPSTNGNEYREEIPNRLWSLWGNSSIDSKPMASTTLPKIDVGQLPNLMSAVPTGKLLARCVVALCVSNIISLDQWNSQLLDRIMLYGSQYHDMSCSALQRIRRDAELTLENLHTSCFLNKRAFWVYTEKILSGKLYSKRRSLGAALAAFFNQHQRTGIVQLRDRALAFGYLPESSLNGPFFLFNCHIKDNHGAPYLLRMRQVQQLLHCILVALNERDRNVRFKIHKVWCVPRT